MADVKLYASERLTDAANAGGRITPTELVDGVTNNLFANIPEDDRVSGRVNLRKLYPKASTADTELYQRMSLWVSKEAQDPAVSCVLFTTGSWTDERSDAANYIENYLASGPISRLYPWDKQAKNQRSVLVLQRPDIAIPEIGSVYFLDDGTNVQPIRVENVISSVQTFTDTAGDYQLRSITLGITEPLQFDFIGGQPTRYSVNAATLVRTSIVANSANYYGISKLALDVSSGALDCTAASIFAPLVPNTANEVSVTDASPSAAQFAVAAASTTVFKDFGFGSSAGSPRYLGQSAMPGSISVTSQLPGIYVDDSLGNILNGATIVGSINYLTGQVIPIGVSNLSNGSHSVGVTYKPAAFVTRDTLTSQQLITISNRRFTYNDTLFPIPAPGTLSVSYLVNGAWYTLTDDGTGTLKGNDPQAVGTVRFDTGTMSITTGALPDVGSSIIESWGVYSDYEIRSGDVSIKPPVVTGQLDHFANRNSVIITWTTGGVSKTATDDGAGNLTGDGTGTIIYSSTNPTTGASVNTTIQVLL
jgi:hypothetical protein